MSHVVRPRRFLPSIVLVAIASGLFFSSLARSQSASQLPPGAPVPDSDRDPIKERNDWFYRGRVVRGLPSAELRRRAYQGKVALRKQRATALAQSPSRLSFSVGSWVPLGPVPLESDASGNGTQDYGYVVGRATAVVVDPADSSGNTVFVGGAQAGIWKSTNAAYSDASSVVWSPTSDDQATLSIGAIAIQPGNNNPANTVILAATGEAINSADSYFGLGILRSTNGGTSWSLVNSANNGAISFSGLDGTRMAFSSATNQFNTVVSAMATSSSAVMYGVVNSGTIPGLYTSLNAGQTWGYNALIDPGGRDRRYFYDFCRLQPCRRTVLRRRSLPRLLLFAGWRQLDTPRQSARRSGTQHQCLSTTICLEQLCVSYLARRNHGHSHAQRDVCLVRLRQRLWRHCRRRYLAEHEQWSFLDGHL